MRQQADQAARKDKDLGFFDAALHSDYCRKSPKTAGRAATERIRRQGSEDSELEDLAENNIQ
jgi:hypothetical protein